MHKIGETKEERYLKRKKTKEREKFLQEIYNVLSQNKKYEKAAKWIETVMMEKKYGYQLIAAEYEREEQEIKKCIFNVCDAIVLLQELHGEKIRLALLSAQITSNPHYFDKETIPGRILVYALSFLKGVKWKRAAEDILEVYYSFHIKPDGISSYTTLYGINLYTDIGKHMAYEHFIKRKESYLVTLSNLNSIVKADCKSKIVFIFENQMVFSHMCEHLSEIPVSMICTSGQMKIASLYIIDMLCEAGCRLYYSGDIDPEGLWIADKVIARNPKQIIPWRLSRQDYILSISNEILNEGRIKKLERIKDERFQEVMEEVRSRKRSGYQEMLIKEMLEDIHKIMQDK